MYVIIPFGLLLLLVVQSRQVQPTPPAVLFEGPNVIFFGPTPAERDSIIRADGLEMAELFDDFDYTSGKVSAFAKGRGIAVRFVTNPAIVVKREDGALRKFERTSLADVVGIILTDGVQEPLLLLGVASDEELISECREFFRLK